MCSCVFFFFFKQKTAYEMRISDWSSDVCSSDLDALEEVLAGPMILPPQDEDRLRGELASPDPDDGGISTALLNGEQDVWLASCGNFYSSPFASADRKSTRLNSSH